MKKNIPKKFLPVDIQCQGAPWLPEAIKTPSRHVFGAVLIHWLYFWVDNFKKKCTTKVVIEKKSCIFPKIIL